MILSIFPNLFLEIATMLIGLVLSAPVTRLIVKLFASKPKQKVPYSEQLSALTSSLIKSTKQVDIILAELSSVTKDRERALTKLESELSILENREIETKKRIEDLQNIPLAAVEHFAQLTTAGEKRSARRDYLLFAAGVIVSTLIAILLKVFKLA